MLRKNDGQLDSEPVSKKRKINTNYNKSDSSSSECSADSDNSSYSSNTTSSSSTNTSSSNSSSSDYDSSVYDSSDDYSSDSEIEMKKSNQIIQKKATSLTSSNLGFLQPKMSNELINKVRTYTSEHGFGSTTPTLTRKLPAEVFKQHYYEKTTLMDFCREIGISTTGQKNDLNDRIEIYLKTGKITKTQASINKGKSDSVYGLKLTTTVINYKSDPTTRAFMEKHVPGFTGFSASVQKWIKESLISGKKLTYNDVVEKHKEYLRDKNRIKKSGEGKVVAHDSCQYNQFLSDYNHDSNKKIHTSKEAWYLVRDSAGDKTYARYKEEIQKIVDKLGGESKKEKSNIIIDNSTSKQSKLRL